MHWFRILSIVVTVNFQSYLICFQVWRCYKIFLCFFGTKFLEICSEYKYFNRCCKHEAAGCVSLISDTERFNTKADLHSICFFIRFCFSMKKFALFRLHFYKSISALRRLLHIDKIFECERREQHFKIKLCPFTKKISESSSSIYYLSLQHAINDTLYKNSLPK